MAKRRPITSEAAPEPLSDDDEDGEVSGLTVLVNPQWRLVHDGLQFRVQELITRKQGKQAGVSKWVTRGYCGGLDSAVYYLASRRIYAITGTFAGCDAIRLLGDALDTVKAECKEALAKLVASKALAK